MLWLFGKRSKRNDDSESELTLRIQKTEDTIKEFAQSLERTSEELTASVNALKENFLSDKESLVNVQGELKRLGKVQFKSNNLMEMNHDLTDKALGTLKKAIEQRERQFTAFGEEMETRIKRESLLFALEDLFAIAASLQECIDMMEKEIKEGGTLSASWITGLKRVRERVMRVLKSLDVEPIPVVGIPFDPNLHIAIDIVETCDVSENTIVAEYTTGYTMNGKILRHAEVGVAKTPQDDKETSWRRESRRWRRHRRIAWAKMRSNRKSRAREDN